ncbi:MAG: 3D domain-containing protein, partial [Clostridiales bacterium]|nr:3D domain-containing protein [Clostridiales bacterium]
HVRKGASTKYKSIGKLKKGQKVKVLASTSKWYKVQYTNKKTGWSHKSNLKKVTTSSSSSSVKKTLKVKAYAYTGGGYTATGTKARYGTLAVDPKVIPYGTKVYIKELDKVFTAEDCGGGIKGNKIDIYMNSESACNKWGVKTITIQILK